jgi:subfamily B ATP-binding cassette protein HlyB/CyaB
MKISCAITMQTSEGELGYQEVLWLLGSLCSLYRLPFDPKLVEQNFPPPHSLATFHEAARALGFKTGHSSHPADWQKLPLPAIAFQRAVPETGTDNPVAREIQRLMNSTRHRNLGRN